MNVLLVYPEMPDTIGKLENLVSLAGRKSAFPPLGLLTVASMLPAEWNKKVIDLNVDILAETDVKWADFVFLSAMNLQIKSAKEVIEICNKNNISVVAGGPLFTHEHEKFQGVSHFVLNEAEITLPLFLKDLETGSVQRIYQTGMFADMHSSPVPMWELIDLNNYLYSVVQFSRGCPYLCDFCDVTALFGRIPRTKTSEQIIQELNAIIAAGNNEMIFFADDNLIGNRQLLKKELLPALIEWRSKNSFAPAFATQLTITLADDPELMQLLLEAGFRHVLIGIESIDNESLVHMKKKQNTHRNILANIKLLQSKGFIIIGTFIVGLDTDKKDVFHNLIHFIQESGIVLVIVNVLKAPPGTELYERMKRENRLCEEFQFDEDRTNIIPVMDMNELHNGYKSVLKEVYAPENVYKRIIQFYTGKNKVKIKYPIKRKIYIKDVFKFLKILYKAGVIYKYRKYFWKLLVWTLNYNYQYIDLSILFGLIMYQYSNLFASFLAREKQGIYIYSQRT